MKTLYIVDAANFLFRSYYAIGPMTNPKGESTNALYGFIRSIYKLITEFSPEYFVAVFDGPENKRTRTAIYSDYKSHRAGMPEDLFPQLEKALHFCTIAGIPHLCVEGVEADDTIGSIAHWAEKKGVDVFICSSDKDLCQLVSQHVRVINPHKDNLLIDKEKVKELFGVYPEQMIDLLAMMGDASDNIPGLEGFGPKTAASLLNTFGSLEKILAHPEKVSGKKQETLRQGKEIALLSQKLATIHLDVEFPKEEEFFHLKAPMINEVKHFYHEMHFLSLLKEFGTNALSTHTAEPQATRVHLVNDLSQLHDLIATLKTAYEICIDTETTDIHPMRAQLVGLGFGIDPLETWYVPVNGVIKKQEVLSLLRPLLEDPHKKWIGHNLKYDIHVLRNEGIVLGSIGFDTMLASYLISPHIQRHNLDELSLEKFGKIKISIDTLIGKGKKQISMAQVPLEQVAAYCCEDVEYTLRLKTAFLQELQQLELFTLFETIELPLILCLVSMERNGIFLDRHQLEEMSKELKIKIAALEHHIHQLANEEFNINSPKQLSAILFEKLQIKPPKKTATGYSTAADVLESLADETPIVKEILEYRMLEKLRSTYIDALPQEINAHTHRIHCTFNQSVAATGRLSCQNPNLQNIPVRTEEGKMIRAAFHPQAVQSQFLSADYSQIELRLLAHLSEDPALIEAFKKGEDIHTFTASLIFDVPHAKVTPTMRNQAKTVNFGILYGQSPFGLSQQLKIDYHDAEAFINTYFLRYPRIKEYLESCKENARTKGAAFTLTGRQRPIPEIHSKNPVLRAAAERLAINTPLQGTAADLIKLAMLRVDQYLKTEPQQGMLILQIHDELLFEAPESQIHTLSHQIKSIMENVFVLKVPLVVDISIGKNWGEC